MTVTAARASIYICTDCGCWSAQLTFWHNERQTCGDCNDARHDAAPARAEALAEVRRINAQVQRRLDSLIGRVSDAYVRRVIARSRDAMPGAAW